MAVTGGVTGSGVGAGAGSVAGGVTGSVAGGTTPGVAVVNVGFFPEKRPFMSSRLRPSKFLSIVGVLGINSSLM